MTNKILSHHGVIGMHWGRSSHRGINTTGTHVVKGRLVSKTHRGTPIHSKESIDKITAEIRSKKINNVDPEKVKTGKKILGNILKAGLGVAILASLPKITRLTNKVLVNMGPSSS